MGMSERRVHPRWEVRDVRAWMFVKEGKPEPCRIVDVSKKGVLVKSSQFLMPGMQVELAFARAHGPNVTRLFRRWAQVARSTPNAFAVFFVNRPVREVASRRRG